jgi:hypothetical protein
MTLNLIQEMKNLNDIPKKTDLFDVPEKYFDTLPAKIQQKIYEKHRKKTVFYSLNWQIIGKVAVGFAVMLIGVVVGIRQYDQPIPEKYPVAHALATVTEDDVKEYLLQSGIAEAEIIEIVATQEADLSGVFNTEIPDELLEEIEVEDVESYL